MTDQAQVNQQEENKLIAERRGKLAKIRENCPANGHPNKFDRKHYAADLQAEHGEKDKETLEAETATYSIAGRVMAKRGPFLVLQDMSGRIQAYAHKTVQKDIKERWGTLDIGDIIGVTGTMHMSGFSICWWMSNAKRVVGTEIATRMLHSTALIAAATATRVFPTPALTLTRYFGGGGSSGLG